MTNVKSLLALYVKMGGSLTDTYSDIAGGIPVGQYSLISDAVLACSKKYSSGGGLPADFPAEGIANADKFLGFDNLGDYAALDAPSGGAEKFVVTLTQDTSGAEPVWVAEDNVTIADVIDAAEDGKDVVVSYAIDIRGMSTNCELPLVQYMSVDGAAGVVFSCITKTDATEAAVFSGFNRDTGDVWMFDSQSIEKELPSFTASNNGQVLGVSSGSLAWVDNYAPLIVTLTAGATEGTFVGDKTYKEVYDAFNANTTVTIKGDLGEGPIAGNVLFVGLTGSDYTVMFCGGDSNVSVNGTANDYITIGG